MKSINYKKALWWEKLEDKKVKCTLCPRYCILKDGQIGFCSIRKNIDGVLYAISYGKTTGFAVDPIEKKPLFHFLPGSEILSFGTVGCNLGCKFCQNWTTTKVKMDEIHSVSATPEQVVELAKRNNVKSIAYTYNEPTIFGEYLIDVSKLAREEGIKSVMVTAGYIDKEARKDVYKYIDAANVDLKAFTERFYWELTQSHLNDVLDTLVWLKNETNVWIEITTLLIPDENDSSEEIKQMSDWILKNLGDSVPLHFSAFHPTFKMMDKEQTPVSTLIRARNIAIQSGVKYCYLGNVHSEEGQTTYCPNCKEPLIIRDWHSIKTNKLKDGKCYKCSQIIDGTFKV
ncbi:MAG: AmmeMemoRadiSam system radical SAM enzyme [Ignavibacteriales bacterium]|nr:AmmeMemoRadiSam system radical SAM enzyme [Ignavibacteriales bacterium]